MIGGRTRVVALLGRPVAHSRSPALHNAWFAAAGLDWVYVALEVAEAHQDRAVDAVRALGLAGANVTVPLKERVVGSVDRLEPDAALTGAVNTLWWEGRRLVGANTDVAGFVASVREVGVDPRGRRAVVVGAGGAARAAVVGLLRDGADVRVAARRPDAAVALCEELSAKLAGPLRADALEERAFSGADLVVVATSGRPAVLDTLELDRLGAGAAWIDLNYWDPDPPARLRAVARGLTTSDGSGMLRAQAELSFERWTGRRPGALHAPDASC